MESTKEERLSAKSGHDRRKQRKENHTLRPKLHETVKSTATDKKLKTLIYNRKKQFQFLKPIMWRHNI